jgi:hypothetical protein
MEKYVTVQEAARELNVPVEMVQSWIESEVVKETNQGLPWGQFVEKMSDELKKEMAIVQQQVLARDED